MGGSLAGGPRGHGVGSSPGEYLPGPIAFGANVHGRRVAFEPRVAASVPRSRASHERILDEALGDFFTEEAFLQVVEGTVEQDAVSHQGMSDEETVAHSMVGPGHDPAHGVLLRERKITREMAQAQRLILAGKAAQARNLLGRLTHTIQDKYPHAHTAAADGRVPLPWNPLDLGAVRAHVASDTGEVMGAPNVRAAVAETRVAYLKLEAAVLTIPPTSGGKPFTPDLASYDAFLKFRGIIVHTKESRDPYLKWDQERWITQTVTK